MAKHYKLRRFVCPSCGHGLGALPGSEVGHHCPKRLSKRKEQLWTFFVPAGDD